MNNRGYMSRIIRANLEASTDSPGVMLGRFCIAKEIPVKDVSEFFKVSRMTIYKWFVGEWIPRKHHALKIEEALERANFSL